MITIPQPYMPHVMIVRTPSPDDVVPPLSPEQYPSPTRTSSPGHAAASPSPPPEPEEMLEVPFPFNRPNADIILRTCDHLDFRLRSQILLEASPVFETLLSLPQPSPDDGTVRDNDIPIVDIAETARVLDALMRICYPIVKPKARPFRDIEPILRAALKYEMELPVAVLSDELLGHATRAPLDVWAIACRNGLEDVARRAAELTLTSQTLDIPGLQDMDGISAGHVFRLHEFHRLQGKVDFSFKLLTPPSVQVTDQPSDDVATPNPVVTDVPLPDLCVVSSDGVEFLVHRSIVTMSSSVLQAQVNDADHNNTGGAIDQESPDAVESPKKIQLDVTSVVLSTLLKACYPGEVELPSDAALVLAVLSACEKLRMNHVRRIVANRWSVVAKTNPLLAFLLATRADLADCAKEAAKYALEDALEGVYLREMEHAPALPYHRLRVHYGSCKTMAKSLLSDVASNLRSNEARHPVIVRPYDDSYPNTQTPSPMHWHGPQFVVTPGSYTPRSDVWLKKHLEQLSKELEQHPGRIAATTGQLVEAAVDAGQWCNSCRNLAGDLCRVGKALQEIPRRVKEVEFEM
ncbi:hypothetical protein OH76DRAFT_1058224 [Lentinus brumalis]|uniref:BTB domain-containing protein n=1 Tax=Lentinus brumalis TaxID=2498619 RepID=A0A371DNB5_9APHY|nr:hypothetical protein OH76DRAFT_1058224 [Polyporus brumalis]